MWQGKPVAAFEIRGLRTHRKPKQPLGVIFTSRSILALLVLFFALAWPGRGHPVAQGSLEVQAGEENLVAIFRISNEQVFVASMAGPEPKPGATPETLWKEHGQYLLAHVEVLADGRKAAGEVAQWSVPADRTVNGFAEYRLVYAWPDQRRPAEVEMRQNLLNEIAFAPGNAWEATFACRILKDGSVLSEGAIFSSTQPLKIDMAPGIVPAGSGLWGVAWGFFVYGMGHIVAGMDHSLFVAALVIAVARLWPIVALVTAFTIAHTITIVLGVLGWVSVPSGIVEPMIAGSIVVAALLNLFVRESAAPGEQAGAPSLRSASMRLRLGIAFGFGLFHGLGFAGGLADAMRDFGRDAFLAAIAGFTVGVELGHQFLVLPLALVLAAVRGFAPTRLPLAVKAGSVAVLLAGGWLLVETLREGAAG